MANFSKNHPQISQRTIEDFKSKLIGGAARPNMFEVEPPVPFLRGRGPTLKCSTIQGS